MTNADPLVNLVLEERGGADEGEPGLREMRTAPWKSDSRRQLVWRRRTRSVQRCTRRVARVEEKSVKIKSTALAALATAALAVTGITSAPNASAVATDKYGTWEYLDCCGGTVTAWKVDNLQPSNLTVPDYPLHGRLWQATATVKAVRGTVTPLIPDMNARAADGQNYQVIWQAYLPETISGRTLAQGQESKGLLLFDVTGQAPDKVVYNNLIQDLLVWQK